MKFTQLMGVVLMTLMSTTAVFSHDEGHGSRLTDMPLYGGAVAPVIQAKDAVLGRRAKMLYKGELTRSGDGTIRIYLYDDHMKPLPLTGIQTKAKAILEVKKNKKWTQTTLELKKEKDTFVGHIPPKMRKPFNIDVFLIQGNKELLVAFDNLD